MKLQKQGVDTSRLVQKYGEAIRLAPFGSSVEGGGAFEGGMIMIVMRVIASYACKMNLLLPKDAQVDQTSLVKVCLLQHIGKGLMFVPNTNTFAASKGQTFTWNDNRKTKLTCGQLSLQMCGECGIPFTDEEFEAMMCNDTERSSYEFRESMLMTLVRCANNMAIASLKKQQQTKVGK